MDERVFRYGICGSGGMKLNPTTNKVFGIHSSLTGVRGSFGKMAFITPRECDMAEKIENKCDWYGVNLVANSVNNEKLYVSSKSKISRDILRNSGYTIVMDPDKANHTIVPKLSIKVEVYKTRIAVIEGSNIYFFNVNKSNYDDLDEQQLQNIIDALKDYFKDKDIEIIHNDGKKFCVFFIPKIDEYEDMLLNRYPNRKYCIDTKVELKPEVNISVETLEIWSRMGDNKVLEKSILNSDWQKYPVTLCVFLSSLPSWYINRFGQLSVVLESIDFQMYKDAKTLGDKIVEPEDWNMLQSWIMHKFGVDEKGGFTNTEKLNDISYNFRDLFRSKTAVAPLNIDTPETFKNLLACLKNSL